MLIDTSGFYCFFDQNDRRHADARTFMQSADARLTTSYVLAELIPLCYARHLNQQKTPAFVSTLLQNPLLEIVWVDEDLHRAAFTLLQERQDKTYSLCDAVSFLLMRERGIGEALTTDKHFEQEGFMRLLP
jgi:uncharacterized protein